MSFVIGKIVSLDGTFYAKAEDGSLRVLSKGDEIYEGEIVVGDSANKSIDSVIVSVSDEFDIVILGNESQLFDKSLSQEEFSQEETLTTNESLVAMLNDIDSSSDIEDFDELETASGEIQSSQSSKGLEVEFKEDESVLVNIEAKLKDFELENNPENDREEILNIDSIVDSLNVSILSASDSGRSNTDNILNDTTPTITGTTEAGSTVVITDAQGIEIGSAIADSTGNFSITTIELTDGVKNLNITVTDSAGNIKSTTQQITIDTKVDSLSVSSLISDEESDSASVLGRTEANAEVTLTLRDVNGVENEVVLRADASGKYMATFDTDGMKSGDYTLEVKSVDIAGNELTKEISGNDLSTFEDTTSIDLASTSDSGVDATDNLTNDATPTITGNTEPNATVEIYDGDILVGSGSADADGNYSITTNELSDGTHSLVAKSSDDAGNEVSSESLVITVDTNITTTNIDLASTSDSGVDATDNLTNDATPTITGNTEPNATVEIYDGDTLVGSGVADANGNYSVTTIQLGDGTHSLVAKASDDAGNEVSSESLVITVDTQTTATVDIQDSSDADDVLNSSEVQNATISGEVEVNAQLDSVVVTDEDNNSVNVSIDNVNINEDGTYTISGVDLSSLDDGTLTVTTSSTDEAGNKIEATDTISKETEASIEIDDTFMGDDIVNNTEQGSVSVSGTTNSVDEGQSVNVTIVDSQGNEVTTTATVQENGTWSVDVDTTSLVDGAVSVSANTEDIYGNNASDSAGYSQDTSFGTVTLDEISDNFVNDAEHGQDLTISGTTTGIENGQEVTVSFNGENYTGSVTDGVFSVSVPAADVANLQDATTYTATVVVTDIAGNAVSDTEDVITDFSINASDDTNAGDLVKEDIDSSASGNVLTNDDANSTVTTTDPIEGDYGTITINADGTYTYALDNASDEVQTLDAREKVSDSFEYTITDAAGNETTATIVINVEGTNDGPVANADTETTSENSAITVNVLANDTDVDDGATLTLDSVNITNGVGGDVSIVNNELVFNPESAYDYLAVGESQDVVVSYTMSDEHGVESTSTATIKVTGTNDAPLLEGSSEVTFVEDGSAQIINSDITLSDIDDANIESATVEITNYVDGQDSLVFVDQNGISGSFEDGVLTLSGDATKEQYEEALESVKYSNSSDNPDLSDRNIEFKVSDGENESVAITSTVNVVAVNDAPTVSVSPLEVDKDAGFLEFNLSASDVDSDIASFTLETLPSNGTLYLDSELTQEVSIDTPIDAINNQTTLFFKPDYGDDSSNDSFGENWFSNNPEVSFSFHATDNGSQELDPIDSATATINITVDDVPFTYSDDRVEVTENDMGSDNNSVSANVLDNDYQGNDGATVHEVTYTAGAETGTATVGDTTSTAYGDLTISEDGSWTFTPDANLAHTNDADTLDFSFSYNTIDGDGDVSNTSTQSITIHDGTDLTIGTPSSDGVVDEANLSTGSDADSDAISVSGTLAVNTGSDAVDVVFDTSMGADANYESTTPSVTTTFNIGEANEIHVGGDGLFVDRVTDLEDTSANAATTSINGHVFTDINLDASDDIVDITGTATKNINLGEGDNTLEVERVYGEVTSGEGIDKIDIHSHADSVIDVKGGDDIVNIGGTASKEIKLGDGDNQVSVGESSRGGISAGDGDDIVNIDAYSEGTINLGDGDNQVEVGDSAQGVITGSGTDTVIINTNQTSGEVNLGAGSDKLSIGGYANGNINLGSGNDIAKINGDTAGTVNLGEGNDQIQIVGHARGEILAGDGNDVVNIGGAATKAVDLGDGNNKLQIDDRAYGDVTSGSGKDEIDIAGHVDTVVETGEGNDVVNIGGTVVGNVDLGAGNDEISIGGVMYQTIDGGEGDDTIELNMDKTTFDTHYADNVTNFETVILNDGAYVNGVFDSEYSGSVRDLDDIADINWNSESDASYEYPLTITSDGDATTTINNIPSGVTATDSSGNAISIVDGVITLDVNSGDTVVTLSSDSSVDLSGVTMTSTSALQEETTQTTDLTHNGEAIVYEISEDGHTLSAKAGDTEVFTVEITDPSNVSGDGAGYTFTLLNSIDHIDNNDVNIDELNIPFNFKAVDADGDTTALSTFSVKVVDDEPLETQNFTINEDTPYSFNISADSVSADDISFSEVGHGVVSYDEASGQVTYTPNEDFSGQDSFTYTLTDADGSTTISSVNIDIKPIVESDTVDIQGSASGVEDSWITLVINEPALKDADDSENISDVTISGIPNGAELRLSDGTTLTITDGSTRVAADRVDELQIKAPDDSNEDFDLGFSFDVTDSATLSDGEVTNVRTFNSSVNVEVIGVADDTSITAQNADAKEASSSNANLFNVSELVSSVSFGDSSDGSETHTISISGLPSDTVIENGDATFEGGVLVFDASELEGLQVSFANAEGKDYDLTIESRASEDDSDSVATSTSRATLSIDATANEIEVEVHDISTIEDEAVNIGVDVINNNPDLDGSETITGVQISGIPVGASILNGDGDILFTSTEGNTTFTDTTDFDAADLEALQILPPPHSSVDFDLDISVQSTDINTDSSNNFFFNMFSKFMNTFYESFVEDAVAWTEPMSVAVEVVAEADTANIEVNSQNDSIEDNWVDIGANVTTPDSLENISLSFSGAQVGTVFSYNNGVEDTNITVTNINQIIKIDADYAQSIKVLPPKDFSGDINISMKTTVTDADGEHTDIETYNNNFTISVKGEADTPILSVKGAVGFEDSEIELDIKSFLRDKDGSEDLSISINNVPNGAVLNAGVDNGDGSWTLQQSDLDGLSITPPQNSNVDFVLSVTATSIESDGDSASTTFELPVKIFGVADTASESTQVSATAQAETSYEDEHIKLELNVTSSDNDSEILTYMLEGVPDDVVLYLENNDDEPIGQFAGFNSDGSSNWIIDADNLDNIVMIPPKDFSGEISMNFKVTVTEDDGNSGVIDTPLNIDIKPVVESEAYSDSQDAQEDSWIELSGENSSIGLSNIGADGEEFSNIVLRDIADGVIVGVNVDGEYIAISANEDGNYELSAQQIDAGVAIKSTQHSDADFDIRVTKTVTDTSDSGNLSVDAKEEDRSFRINLDAKANTLAEFDVNSGSSGDSLGSLTSYAHTDTDGSEYSKTYFVIESADEDNTNYIIDGAINAGNGTWIVTDLDSATIRVLNTDAGDGTLNLKVTPFVREDSGDTLQDSANVQNFEISYDVTTDSYIAPSNPNLNIEQNAINTLEDEAIEGELLDVSSDGELSYVVDIQDLQNASMIMNSDLFELPDGTFLTTNIDAINLQPTDDFSGNVNAIINVISTDKISGGEATSTQSVDINVSPVTDGYGVEASAQGDEDSLISMPISLSSIDSDGSEFIVDDEVIVTLNNGGTLSVDNASSSFVDNGDSTYTMSSSDLVHLQFKAPQNTHGTFELSVDFSSQEAGSELISQHQDFSVVVKSVGDEVSLGVDADSNIVVDEGSNAIDLGLSVALADSDGSEYGFVVISGVPDGASLSNGYAEHNSDGTSTWHISAQDAPNTSIVFQENFNSEEFTLSVVGQRFDFESESLISTDAIDIGITVNPITDGVTIHNSYTQGLEDTTFDMNLSFSMGNMDSSETLNFTFDEVPHGSTINYTVDGEIISIAPDANGSVTLENISFDEARSFTFTPPLHMSGHIDIDMSVASVDVAGNLMDISDIVEADLSIDVVAVSSGFDGEGISATISEYTPTDDGISVNVDVTGVSVIDADGSEILTLNIQGLGESAVLSYLNANGESQIADIDNNGDWSITFNPATDDYATIMQTITINATNADDLEGNITFSATLSESSNGSSTTIFNSVNVAQYIANDTLGGDTYEELESINKNTSFDLNATLPDTQSPNEKLGIIEIKISDSAELNYANGDSVATSNGVASIIIVNDSGEIDDSVHALNQNIENAITMTQSQFESLQVTPVENFSGDLNIETSFSECAVDNSNNIIEGIDSVNITNTQTISVENAIDGTDGNDTIVFDDEDVVVDGLDGFDTLVFEDDVNIDMSALGENISNIESINLGDGTQNITSLHIENVLDMTGENDENILRIDGDESDSINLNTSGDDAEWTLGNFKTDAETGEIYQEVTGGEGDRTVTLEISTDIEIHEN
nr:Ig-like domain-containing protein [uncultured Sulfurimonas sp.]